MRIKTITTVLLLFALLTIGSCSKKGKKYTAALGELSKPDIAALQALPFTAASLIIPDMDSLDIKQVAKPQVIRPQNASDFLGGSVDRYLQYDFVGLVATKYTVGGKTVSVEIAEFAEPEDAYGHYATLRPNGIATSRVGAESFVMGATRYFTRGTFVVTLSAEDDSEANMKAVDILAEQINNHLTGKLSPPPFFMMFPYRDKVIPSTKFYRYNYLGIPKLDKVYTTDYVIEGDTMTLFLTMDESGGQFVDLESYAESAGKRIALPPAFEFDNGYGIAFEHPTYGLIIAGLARQKLVGVIGYKPATMERFVSMWVKGLRM